MSDAPATPPPGRYARLAWAFVLYSIAVILWGAFVRASLSGDGCGDHWPLCDGELVPVAPSTKKLVELTHRITSGFCWIGALAFWIVARRRHRREADERSALVRKGAFWGFFFMTTEALVGAGLVLFRMVAENPDTARGYWMGAHLVNTYLLVAALTLHAWWASAPSPEGRTFRLRGSHGVGFVALAIGMLAVGITGAIAALGDTLFPVDSLAEGLAQDLDPTSHVFLRLRVAHPVVALVTAGATAMFGAALAASADRSTVRRHAFALVALVGVQVGLGFLNVALLAPVWLQLVHLAVADAVWIALLLLAAEHGTQPVVASSVALSEPA
ncbi:MAG: COX15/CtaA family protein [Sandaracinus sp.]|nr:COX15/CtaA family protein [Sandaracinus sp.]MCB9633460.1 COX15/CtaA family protein [Sandaracinus sp.]